MNESFYSTNIRYFLNSEHLYCASIPCYWGDLVVFDGLYFPGGTVEPGPPDNGAGHRLLEGRIIKEIIGRN